MKNKIKTAPKSKKLYLVLGISLLFNALFVAMLVGLRIYYSSSSGRIDYVGNATYIQCSETYKNDLKTVTGNSNEWARYYDFLCQQNGAEKYFQQGLENYQNSLDK